jgi:hypothetical protein
MRMSQWNIAYWDEGKIVPVTASGVLNLALIKKASSEAIATAAQHGATKYFVDNRGMVPDVATIDIYNLPKALGELGLQRTDKVALVYSQSSPKKEDFEFFETVAANNGFSIRLFTAVEAAIEWLKSR